MKNNQFAIVWRESIHHNDYVCKCGAKLWDYKKNMPTDNIQIDVFTGQLYCVDCGLNVAYITDIKTAMKSAIMEVKA